MSKLSDCIGKVELPDELKAELEKLAAKHGRKLGVEEGNLRAVDELLGKTEASLNEMFEQLKMEAPKKVEPVKEEAPKKKALTPEEQAIQDELKELRADSDEGLGQSASKKSKEASITDDFLASRGLTAATATEPLSAPNAPKAAGKTFASDSPAAREGVFGVDPALAGGDTKTHEALHHLLRSAKLLADRGDKQAQRMLAVIEAAGGEEVVVQASGEKLARMLSEDAAAGRNTGTLARAIDVLTNSLKMRVGKAPRLEKISDYLAALGRTTGADISGRVGEFTAKGQPPVTPGNPTWKEIRDAKRPIEEKMDNVLSRVATSLDSPLEKLKREARTPEQKDITNYAVERINRMLDDTKMYTGSFQTKLFEIMHGGKVSDFLLATVPGGERLSKALGRPFLSKADKILISEARTYAQKSQVIGDAAHPQLKYESPEIVAKLKASYEALQNDPRLLEVSKRLNTDVYAPLRVAHNEVGGGIMQADGSVLPGRISPTFDPQMQSAEMIKTLRKDSTSPEAIAIKKRLIEYNHEIAKDEFEKNFKREFGDLAWETLTQEALDKEHAKLRLEVERKVANEIKNITGSQGIASEKFTGLREKSGIGLPVDMLEPDAFVRAERYIRKSGHEIAYTKHLESDKAARAALDLPDAGGKKLPPGSVKIPGTKTIVSVENNPLITSEAVNELLNTYKDYDTSGDRAVRGLSRLATSMWLGPISSAKDMAGSVIRNTNYIPGEHLPGLWAKGLRDVGKFYKESMELGVNNTGKHGLIEFSNDTISTGLDVLNHVSDTIAKLQGRTAAEQMTRALLYAQGRHFADLVVNTPAGKNPMLDRAAKLFGGEAFDRANATPDQRKAFAARFVEAHQGSYNVQNLASLTLKGKLSPFFTLQRWNVEMMNRFMRENVIPIVKLGKDWKAGTVAKGQISETIRPLLQYSLTAALGGLGVRMLTEVLSNKLNEKPTMGELQAKGRSGWDLTDPQTALFWSGSLEMASYAGFLGQLGSTAVNNMTGVGGTADVGAIPVFQFAADNGATLKNFIQAIESPEDIPKMLPTLLLELGKNNLQAWRVINNRLENSRPEETAARQLARKSDRLDGKKLPAPQKTNPFQDFDYKKLDKARGPEEVSAALVQAVKTLRARVAAAPDDQKRAVAKREYDKFKTPEKPFLPSDPTKLVQFVEFTRKAHGEEGLKELLTVERERREAMSMRR